uniref:hypothetical protein n=1 Tax=Paenarthrobacter nicotinovorans TaxID=29320 RepID=UPI003F496FFE
MGRVVELWHGDRYIRTSLVDDATPDLSVIWLSLEGVDNRQLIHKDDGFDIYLVE